MARLTLYVAAADDPHFLEIFFAGYAEPVRDVHRRCEACSEYGRLQADECASEGIVYSVCPL